MDELDDNAHALTLPQTLCQGFAAVSQNMYCLVEISVGFFLGENKRGFYYSSLIMSGCTADVEIFKSYIFRNLDIKNVEKFNKIIINRSVVNR